MCRFAILAGDPMQLPPLIANPSQTQQRPGAPTHGLPRPLFTRLMAAGHAVHMLRRQYRYSTASPEPFCPAPGRMVNLKPSLYYHAQWAYTTSLPLSDSEAWQKHVRAILGYHVFQHSLMW